MELVTQSGMIGKSGKWYPCSINNHLQCEQFNKHDAPFVIIRTFFGETQVSFDAYYTVSQDKPTQAQFETLMSWCTFFGKRFEDVTDCWDAPWEEWRE